MFEMQIVKEWVKELAIQRGQVNANVVLFTFGSYHLGVMYMLCVAYFGISVVLENR